MLSIILSTKWDRLWMLAGGRAFECGGLTPLFEGSPSRTIVPSVQKPTSIHILLFGGRTGLIRSAREGYKHKRESQTQTGLRRPSGPGALLLAQRVYGINLS